MIALNATLKFGAVESVFAAIVACGVIRRDRGGMFVLGALTCLAERFRARRRDKGSRAVRQLKFALQSNQVFLHGSFARLKPLQCRA